METKTNIRLLLLVIGFLFAFVFSYFRWSQFQENNRLDSTFRSLMRNDSLAGNTYEMSKSILDLERLGLIKCAKVAENLEEPISFYDSTSKNSCDKGTLAQLLNWHQLQLKAVNGLNYTVSIEVPTRWDACLLECMTYSLIVALAFIYIKQMQARKLKDAVSEALVAQSRQVAHDIRSPLSALNMITRNIRDLPTETMDIILSSTSRINDIATNLLAQSKRQDQNINDLRSNTAAFPILILPLISAIINEKNVQLGKQNRIALVQDIDQSAGLMVRINPTAFSSMLSNLINNSIESMAEPGVVTIATRSTTSVVSLIVSDTGKGIPDEILADLGTKQISFGKSSSRESGSGLGVYHAHKTTVEAGGRFVIQSKIGFGTIVSMSFPIIK